MAEAAYAPVTETLAPVVGPTPEEIERRKLMAAALLKDAMGSEPIGHWTQGVANIVQALMAGRMEKKAGEEDAAAEAAKWQGIMAAADAGLFGGGGGGEYAGSEYAGGETADVPGAEAVAATGDDADMIIRTVIGEAAGEPPEGQQAVASVIMNRARQAGMTPSQVVLAKGQFEPWGSRAGQLRAIDPNSEQYRRVAANVLPVLQGQASDPTGGATHFYAPRAQAALGRSTPSWARGQGLDIGNHRFYSLGYPGGGRHGTETADIPGAEPVSTAPSSDVMTYLGAGTPPERPPGPPQSMPRTLPPEPQEMPITTPPPLASTYTQQPLGMVLAPQPVPPPRPLQDMPPARLYPPASVPPPAAQAPIPLQTAARPRPEPPPMPLAPVAPPAPIIGQDAPVAGPPIPPQPSLAARLPQPRPEPPVAPAAPATTGTVAAPAPARPVYAPPVKNDYNAMPGRPPAALPMRPGQLMQEPYSGPMSAQEFARQGQAAMRARAAGQQPTGLAYAPTPGGQPAQPRRGLLQALLGRSGPQGAAGAPAAPVASGAPAGGTAAPMDPRRAAMANLLANPRVDASIKLAALKNMSPKEREAFTLSPGQVRYGPDGRPVAAVPDKPEKGTDDQREYQQAVSEGYTGSFVDYMREIKKAGATSVTIANAPEAGDAKLRASLGEKEGERWSKLQEAGVTASGMAQDMALLDELIEVAPTGPLTGRLAQAFPGFSDAGAAFQSIIDKNAPALRVEGSGSTSDIEFAGMLRSMPALRNRPEANRLIAGTFKAKAALNIERSEIVTAYQNGDIDAATARKEMAALNRRSIVTPEMDRLIKGVSGTAAESESGGSVARPTSEAEYDALPSETLYIAPDGTTQRKP